MQKNELPQAQIKKLSRQEDIFSDSLFLGFITAGLVYLLLITNLPLLAAMDITLIPVTGEVSEAFRTGNFSFTLILLFGMHLIKLGGLLTGVVYMVMNVYAGITYIVADGMLAEKESGKNALTNAFLGFGLAVFSWIIVDVFITFLITD